MEFLEGHDLSDEIASRGTLPVEEAADFLLQACEAVAEAHSLGIVHRDLKPANLFLTGRNDGTPLVKVLDFGISKVTNAKDMSMTSTGSVMGSPYYMSPEQMRASRELDLRADIWSLGVVLFEMLTGRPPFLGESMPELCVNVLTTEPPRLRELRPELPAGVEAVIARCLQRKADDRYQTLLELSADLAPFAPASSQLSVERVARMVGGAASGVRSTLHSIVHPASLPPPGSTSAPGAAAGLPASGASLPGVAGVSSSLTGTLSSSSWGTVNSAGQRSLNPKHVALGAIALLSFAGILAIALGRSDAGAAGTAAVADPSNASASRAAVAAGSTANAAGAAAALTASAAASAASASPQASAAAAAASSAAAATTAASGASGARTSKPAADTTKPAADTRHKPPPLPPGNDDDGFGSARH
jgi:serine/threonine-protein kinase